MQIIVIEMLCIVWVQNSCAAPKWNTTNLDLVDDSDLLTDYGFLDTDLDNTERTLKNFDDDSDTFTDYDNLDMDLDIAERTSEKFDDDLDPLFTDTDLNNGTGFVDKGSISDVGLPAIELTAILAVFFMVLICLGFLVELAKIQIMEHCNSTESANLINPDPEVNNIDEYQNTRPYSIPSPVSATDPSTTKMDSDFLADMGTKVRSQIDDYQNMLAELMFKLNYLNSSLAELTADAEDVQDVFAKLEPSIHDILKAYTGRDKSLVFTISAEETEHAGSSDTSPEDEKVFDPDCSPVFGHNSGTLPEVDGLEDPFGGFESYELSDSITNFLEGAFGSHSSRASSEDSLQEITGAYIREPKDVSPSDQPSTGEEKGDKTTSQPPSEPSGCLQPELQYHDLSPPVTSEEKGDKATCQPPAAPSGSCQPKTQHRECPMPPKSRRKVRFHREVRRKTFVVGNPILAFAAPEKKHKIEEFQDTQPLKGDGVGRIPGVLKKNRSFLRSIFRKPSFLKKKEVKKWRI